MYATKYKKLTRQALAANDHNMCSVLAVALTCRTNYETVRKLHADHGRKHRQGTYWFTTEKSVKALGYKMVDCTRKYSEPGKRSTINNTAHKLQRGYYLVLINRHVLAVHNGTVHDWSKGRRHHIKGIWKIEKETNHA